MTVRTNMHTNPSNEAGSATPWNTATTNTTIAFSTTSPRTGSQNLKLTRVTGGTTAIPMAYGSNQTTGLPNSESFTITPNTDYTFSFYAYTPNSGVTMRVLFYWMTSTGFISSVNSGVTSVTSGYTRFSFTATSPSTAVKMGVGPWPQGVPNSGVVYFDDFLIEQGSTLGAYFDGNTAAGGGKTYAWTGTANLSSSTETSGTVISSSFAGTGTLSTAVTVNKGSNFSGSGALSTLWTNYVNIDSQFAGAGTLSTVVDATAHIDSAFSGTGTLSTALTNYQNIDSSFAGTGTLSTLLAANYIASNYSGEGQLYPVLSGLPTNIFSDYSAEGVLFTELAYSLAPTPTDELPLQKLVSYTINNAAVPLNPAEGSGSTPSVNASYIKGRNPEFALGEDFTITNGAIGSYTGEIVRLSLNKKSDVATISTDTLLTLANVDMHLYPFIDAAPNTWTAARAIEYWTQQCGMFYDKVDGECAVYASGYGHNNGFAFGAGNSRFYERLTSGATSTVVLNNRSVTSFGSAATSVMAQHEAELTRVPITVGANRKMVFSIGLGLRGTGRTASASFKFVDGSELTYDVTLEATSAGTISAKVEGAVISTASVTAGGNYRVSFSIQRMSDTAMVGKLTVHEDDLEGNGDLIEDGLPTTFYTPLPGTLWLMSLVHASAGGSGSQMLRWGTYLSVAKNHPVAVPRVQKTLSQSGKPLGFVSGFSANVWKMMNEFCSINRMDISFVEDRLVLGPRVNGFNGAVKLAEFELTSERREKYKQVAVVNKQSKAVPTETAVLWRADSVFQVAAREIFETTVKTEHSILSLANPVAVTGITPFPYLSGAGQYVVTGADGYIVSPAWWEDNGGKVEVSMTEVDGEIAIKITAPSIDTVRAPYRISEGEGDRPALYISGSGIVNKPVELHINSGARHAREGFDNVFESAFIATTADAFNTSARMAQLYSAAVAEVSFEARNDFDVPSDLGISPSGVVFTDNERNFKITETSQTHTQVSGSAIPFTTLAAYKASFPAGATIADEKLRHTGRTIKQANIKPLRSNSESA